MKHFGGMGLTRLTDGTCDLRHNLLSLKKSKLELEILIQMEVLRLSNTGDNMKKVPTATCVY